MYLVFYNVYTNKCMRAVAQMSNGVYTCKIFTLYVKQCNIICKQTTTSQDPYSKTQNNHFLEKERELVTKLVVEGKRWNI